MREKVAAIVDRAEIRARRRYALDATGILERYGVLTGLLEQLSQSTAFKTLSQRANWHLLYYPFKSDEVFCVRKLAASQKPELLEMKERWGETRPLLDRLFGVLCDSDSGSIGLQGNEDSQENGPANSDVSRLVNAALADQIKTHGELENAPVLLLPFEPPEHLLRALPKGQQWFTGLLVLVGDNGAPLPASLREDLREECQRYVDNIRRLSSQEPHFLIPSLVNLDARIQESTWRGLGYAIYMLLHRFRNLRQAAGSIAEQFPTAADVQSHQQMYEERIRDMRIQMEEIAHLENILRYLPGRPEIVPRSVLEVKEILEYLFQEMSKSKGVEAQLLIELQKPELLTQQIDPPSELIEEVFSIHLDNALREIGRPSTRDKRLIVEIYEEYENVCFSLTNLGPPIPPDIQADLRQIVQVPSSGYGVLKRPQRTGLGVFLSAVILQQVGGAVEFRSPVEDGIGANFTLRFRKYIA